MLAEQQSAKTHQKNQIIKIDIKWNFGTKTLLALVEIQEKQFGNCHQYFWPQVCTILENLLFFFFKVNFLITLIYKHNIA